MGRGPSMLLRDDLVEIVIRTQAALGRRLATATDSEAILREIAEALRDKGLLGAAIASALHLPTAA